MLSNLVKLTKKRKIIGRGGDRGGTSGKGHKGQKARSGGGVSPQFEGGQTPLTRRLPKRGFSNEEFKTIYEIISFDVLEKIYTETNLTSITKSVFVEFGIINTIKKKIKLLSNGDLKTSLIIEIDACSKSAKAKIESLGGSVSIV